MSLVEENIILRFQTEATDALADINKIDANIGSLTTSAEKAEKVLAKGYGNIDTKDLVTKLAQSEGVLQKFQKALNATAKTDFSKLEKELTDVISKVKLTDKEFEFLQANIGEVTSELLDLAKNAKKVEVVAQKAEVLTKEFKNAKQELTALSNAIKSGDLTGNALSQAKLRAGELKDRIGDVNDEINRLASDTPALDNLGDTMRLAGAGFQIAEGSMALFGDESEELQKSLLKLNSVMAISNGLQDLGRQLTEKGTLANRIAIGVQTAWNIAVGQGSIAMKIFRGALVATGVGALVVGLGLLIANFDAVKKAVSNIEGFKKIAKIFDDIRIAIFSLDDAIIGFYKSTGSVLANLASGNFTQAYEAFKNIGSNTAKAFREGQKDVLEQDKQNAITKALEDNIKTLERNVKRQEGLGKDTYSAQKKLIEAELNLLRRKGADINEIKDKELELEILRGKRAIELRDKELQDLEATYIKKEILLRQQEKNEEELAFKLELLEIEKGKAIANAKLKFNPSNLDKATLENDIQILNDRLANITKSKETFVIEPITRLKIGEVEQDSIEKYIRKIQEIKQIILNNGYNDDAGLQAEIDDYVKRITESFNKTDLEKEIKGKKSLLTALIKGDDKEIDKILSDQEIQKLRNERDRVAKDLSTGAKIGFAGESEDSLNSKLLDADIALAKKRNEIIEKEAQDKKTKREEEIAGLKLIKDATLDLTNTILDDAIRRKDLEIRIQQDKVNGLLQIIDKGNAEQVQLEESRLKKLNDEKQKYLNVQRRLAAVELSINTAVAASTAIVGIVKAFRDGNIFKGIGTTLALAASIASTIIAVRSAFSNVPAYFDGTENTSKKGKGNVDGRGGFNAILHPNERVVSAKENRDLLNLGVANKDLPKYVGLGMRYERLRFAKPQSISVVNEYKDLLKENKKTNNEIKRLQEILLNSGTRLDISDENISVMVGNAAKRKFRERNVRI